MLHKGIDEESSIKLILTDFFKNKGVSERFQFLNENEIFGFEKWMQIELLKYLHDNDSVPSDDIFKEEFAWTDQRKKDDRIHQFLDITFRVKGKQYYIPIELKAKNYLALTEINRDMIKNNNIVPNGKSCFRKIFYVLIHPHMPEQQILEKINSFSNFSGTLSFSALIPKTTLSCTVFANNIS